MLVTSTGRKERMLVSDRGHPAGAGSLPAGTSKKRSGGTAR